MRLHAPSSRQLMAVFSSAKDQPALKNRAETKPAIKATDLCHSPGLGHGELAGDSVVYGWKAGFAGSLAIALKLCGPWLTQPAKRNLSKHRSNQATDPPARISAAAAFIAAGLIPRPRPAKARDTCRLSAGGRSGPRRPSAQSCGGVGRAEAGCENGPWACSKGRPLVVAGAR